MRLSQFEFTAKSSCCTQSNELLEIITQVTNGSTCVDVICSGFAKAFSSVPQKRLMENLYAMGIIADLDNRLDSFNLNRKEAATFLGHYSSSHELDSGVQLGFVFEPLLFVAYIIDIATKLGNVTVFKYVDDIKLYLEIYK